MYDLDARGYVAVFEGRHAQESTFADFGDGVWQLDALELAGVFVVGQRVEAVRDVSASSGLGRYF